MPHRRGSGFFRLRCGVLVLVLALVGAWLTAVATAPAALAARVGARAAGADPSIRVTFHYTGGVQTWTVPVGVTRASFDVYGAEGGGSPLYGILPIIKGGKGGFASAKIKVTPGEVIHIFVGGKGGDGGELTRESPPEQSRGGFNGGGNARGNAIGGAGGGGGGGASDVRVGGTHVSNRVIVAGGGGGSSEKLYVPCGFSHGGGGGGLTGADGVAAVDDCTGGTGGTQTGSGAQPGYPAGGGSLGFGGKGLGPLVAKSAGGGGGGGGYYGGGGGFLGGGGGGGSGFGPRGAKFETGVRAGDGEVVVTGGDNPPQLTLVKHVDNGHAGGTADDRSWVLQASGPSSIFGRTRDPEITRAQVEPGTYRLTEAFGPAGYSASQWFCRGTIDRFGDVIQLAEGDRVVCGITNTAIAPRITLVKKVSAGDTGGFETPQDWTLTAEGPRRVSGKSGSPEVTDVPVAAGTYTLKESGPGGYAASAWHCGGGVLTGHQLFLALGYRATCTVTNTAIAPRLTLVKHVDNSAGGIATPDAWILAAAGPVTISGRTGERVITDAPVKTGVYRLSEAGGPPGYTASGWVCQGGTLVGDSVHLPLGVHATCKITNTAVAPRLTLVKRVDNAAGGTAGPDAWTLAAAGPVTISGRTGQRAITDAPVKAGVYRLSEAGGAPGYTASAWACDGGLLVRDTLHLPLGVHATCTITNTAIAPRLTLVKRVDNAAGGSAGPEAWTLTAAGPVTISGRTGQRVITDAPVKTGDYRLSESTGPPGYAASAWVCHGATVIGHSFHLPLGVHATCTITNTYHKATPTLTTQAAGSGQVGGVVFDEATLSGGRDHTGTITFRLYGPNDVSCTGPVLDTSRAAVTPHVDRYRSGLTHPIIRAGVYRYVASYSGDRENDPVSGACGVAGESATVAAQTPRITTIATGGVAGGTVRDTARLTGHPHVAITGQVRFTLYGPGDDACATPLATSTGAVVTGSVSTGPVAVTGAGSYRWIAAYTGDANNAGVSSACAGEPVTVSKLSPSIRTTPSGNVAAGAVVLDAATLAGGYQPTGIVTFALYGPDDPTCEHAPAAMRTGSVSDGSASSQGVAVTQAGTYHWVATYGGDDNNAGARSSCGDELVTVGPGSLARLALAPASVTVHVGSGQAYAATGYDAYGNLIGDVTGQTTFTIDGGGSCHANSCTGPVGPHTVTGTAQSASGTATLLISAVNQAPAITSAAGATFLAGRAGSFKITATGLPTPSLTASGRLPAGIRFDDHGNATATLSGTPAAGTAGAYRLTITARNGVSPNATQRFVLTVRERPPARATVRVSRLRATPLRHGCVTETATDESEITAVIVDATCRHFLLTVQGTIESNGKRSATGAVQVKVKVKLPRRSAAPSARGSVSHGRWRISLVLPGVNLDPVPPTYVITVHYDGDNSTQPATATRRIRIESERAGLN